MNQNRVKVNELKNPLENSPRFSKAYKTRVNRKLSDINRDFEYYFEPSAAKFQSPENLHDNHPRDRFPFSEPLISSFKLTPLSHVLFLRFIELRGA